MKTFGGAVVGLALVLTSAAAPARAQGNIDFAKLEIQTVKIADGVMCQNSDEATHAAARW
jgi:hypothetical protein